MELVYLWVEEYKNIKGQEFNFSSKFNCHYDEVNKELTIKDNPKHIFNFFGEDINVTAIVGKNGSGKSSILEVIENIYMDNNIVSGVIFCFEVNGKKVCISNIDIKHKGDFEINIIEFTLPFIGNLSPHNLGFNFLTYSAEIPYPSKDDRKKFFYERGKAISLHQEDIYEMAANYLDSDFHLSSFMFLPEKIYILQNNDRLNILHESIKPAVAVRSNNPENGFPFEDSHDERDNFGTSNILEAYFVNKFVENDLSHILFDGTGFDHPKHGYNIEILEEIYNQEEYGLNDEKYNLDEFNTLLEKRIFEKHSLNEEDKVLIEKYKWFLKFDFEDKEKRKYSDLSHGEKTIYGQLLNIYHKSNILVDTSMLIVLDEPELSLHPQWQKSYMNELFDSVFYLRKQLHFIITTHSPFLLSDIPKQNIIFLDKYKKDDEKVNNETQKEGNCKVFIDGLKEKEQTFGANIHTLLSDNFFMDNGLMGEFAKKKIQEIMDFLNDTKTIEEISTKKEQIKQVIDAIGEPFLKQKLLEMYYKKFKDEASKKARKDELLAEQKRIEAELKNYG
ncbi:MAG: Unknown protein [uncultured Sulfurovum sp.]|uniref:AAA+ ATPase domain-containing protein n=1 Tax=uncultured Sulfurovum sp. TaxID=269237 RepID=A0A6S6S6K2_9BACT|nr:MAG: Unknown protein [uncultured Sulfurovum sp.]